MGHAGKWSWVSAVAVALALAGGAPHAWAEEGQPGASAPRVITITAKRFEFTPKEIVLEKGKPVTLQVTSADVTHGFFQKELGIDLDIVPGKVNEVTITPKNAGTYTIICDHFCGSGHGNMKMTVKVQAAGEGEAAR
jgi:cytochrome c oxidase subunit 2